MLSRTKAALLLVGVLGLVCGQPRAYDAGAAHIVRVDPALDALVAPDAKLEEVLRREGTTFEGPTWVRSAGSGYLLFTDVPGNVIDKLNSDGTATLLLDHIFAGQDPSEAFQSSGLHGQKKLRMIGANGATLDLQGRLIYCAYSDGQIVRLERDGRRTVLASHFGAYHLNAPNDVVVKSDGSIWFTDSRAGVKRGPTEGVPHKGLYVLKGREVRLLSKDIDHPNGLAFSLDEKQLYVTNSMVKTVLRFDVTADGIANEQVFADMSADPEVGIPDGIKLDERGNIYSTGPGGIWILSPEGQHLGTVVTPQQVNNLTFGGHDLRSLYMVGYGVVYRMPVKVGARR
jgi:gluconolactonase